MIKRILWILLTALLTVSLCACASPAITETTEAAAAPSAETDTPAPVSFGDAELDRAYGYGIFPQRFFDDLTAGITFADYDELMCCVLGSLPNVDMELYSTYMGKMAELTEPMPCSDALLDNYIAALAAGDAAIDFTDNFDKVINEKLANIDDWSFSNYAWNDYPIGDEYENPDIYVCDGDTCYNWGFTNNARIFNMLRCSPCTGNTIYFQDWTEDGSDFTTPATAEYALRMANRLYEALYYEANPQTLDKTAQYPELQAKIDARREAILNSETNVSCTGTAYYVAANGNDENDGLSESAPWATLSRVNSAELKSGDAVFFRRGDAFYGSIQGQEGVTYSAYGTGAKPIISQAVDRTLADAGRWELYYEGGSGERIWVARDVKQAVGNMIFNGGESCAVKDCARYIGGAYYTMADETVPYDVTTALTDDLTFFFDGDNRGYETEELEQNGSPVGNLYLRCDAGDPAVIYDCIDCSAICSSVFSAPFNVFDNLSFRFGSTVICYPYTDVTIQNCEGCYFGGIVGWYADEGYEGAGFPVLCGDTFSMGGVNNTLVNCYAHDTLDGGIHIEYDPTYDKVYDNISATGCLVERCGSSCTVVNFGVDQTQGTVMTNVTISDNYICDTAEPGWGLATRQRHSAAPCFNHSFALIGALTENTVVEDNLFCGCYNSALLYSNAAEERYKPRFTGNTFVGNPGEIVFFAYDDSGYMQAVGADAAAKSLWIQK